MHVTYRFLRREPLKRCRVGALVDDDLVKVQLLVIQALGNIHLVPLGTQSCDVPFGEDFYPAAHSSLFDVDKYLHVTCSNSNIHSISWGGLYQNAPR